MTNAAVYTVNPQQPRAEAVAVRGGAIAAVGSNDEIARLRGAGTQVIDAGGRLVLPGLTDTHVHFMGGALARQRVILDDAATVEEMQRRVKAYADAHPDQPWILGGGWYYSAFGDAALPDRRMLDAVVADRPVLLSAYDGHSSWANSKALEMAGITRATPDPPNGVIVRDPRSREATGALKESAGNLVEKVVPEPTRDQRLQALRQAIAYANSIGVTRVHSAGGDAEVLELLAELRGQEAMTLRMVVTPFINPPAVTPEVLARAEQLRTQYHDEWLNVSAVKFMLDGVIEAHTAAVLEALRQRTAHHRHPQLGSGRLRRRRRRVRPPRLPDLHPRHRRSCDSRRPRRLRGHGARAVTRRPPLPRRAHREPERCRHPAFRRPGRDREHAAAARHPRRQQPERLGQGDRPRARVAGLAVGTAAGRRRPPGLRQRLAGGDPRPLAGAADAAHAADAARGRRRADGCPTERIAIEQAIEGYTLGAAMPAGSRRPRGRSRPARSPISSS